MANKGNDGGHSRRTPGFQPGSSGQTEHEHGGLKESAQEMVSQLGESAGHVRDKAREFVSGIAGQAQETWQGARDDLHERFGNISGKAGDIYEDGLSFVRRYPLASLAAAFSIGCLASCALFSLPRSTREVPDRMSRASS